MGGMLMAVFAAVAVMFLISLFRQKQQPMQYAGAGTPHYEHQPSQQPFPSSGTAAYAANIPSDFPVESFLRSAKTSFIRLQAANDRKDLNDIREYTTPEMFAEISMQIHERDDTPQRTDVISIDAGLLQVANEGDYATASVRFTGQLRENNGTPGSVDEIWHVQKSLRDEKSVWLLAGIQQVALH
jgi:predicted lipid-binding transport protein (Tim44 family)